MGASEDRQSEDFAAAAAPSTQSTPQTSSSPAEIHPMKFFLAREGVAFGPYSEFQLRESIRLGIFESRDLALAENGTEWLEVSKLFPVDPPAQESPGTAPAPPAKAAQATELVVPAAVDTRALTENTVKPAAAKGLSNGGVASETAPKVNVASPQEGAVDQPESSADQLDKKLSEDRAARDTGKLADGKSSSEPVGTPLEVPTARELPASEGSESSRKVDISFPEVQRGWPRLRQNFTAFAAKTFSRQPAAQLPLEEPPPANPAKEPAGSGGNENVPALVGEQSIPKQTAAPAEPLAVGDPVIASGPGAAPEIANTKSSDFPTAEPAASTVLPSGEDVAAKAEPLADKNLSEDRVAGSSDFPAAEAPAIKAVTESGPNPAVDPSPRVSPDPNAPSPKPFAAAEPVSVRPRDRAPSATDRKVSPELAPRLSPRATRDQSSGQNAGVLRLPAAPGSVAEPPSAKASAPTPEENALGEPVAPVVGTTQAAAAPEETRPVRSVPVAENNLIEPNTDFADQPVPSLAAGPTRRKLAGMAVLVTLGAVLLGTIFAVLPRGAHPGSPTVAARSGQDAATGRSPAKPEASLTNVPPLMESAPSPTPIPPPADSLAVAEPVTPSAITPPPPDAADVSAAKEAPTRKIVGRMFIVDPNGTRYQPSAVEVRLYPLALLRPYLERRGTEASAKFEELRGQIAEAEANKEQLRKASNAAFDAYVQAEPGTPEKAALEKASTAAKKAREQATNSYYELLQDREEILSGAFYLENLPKPTASTQTDSQGTFSFDLPAEGEFAVVAGVQKNEKEAPKRYYWFVPVNVAGEPTKEILLSNNNLSSQGSAESLVLTVD